MSVKLMGLVWELDLPHNQLLVALALADHGKDDGSSIYPSIGHVAWKVGYSDRQVQRIMRSLEDMELLVKIAESNGYRPAEYRMMTANAPAKPPWQPDRGDKTSGVTNCRPDTDVTPGVTSEAARGDIAASPEPSIEPPGNHPAPDGAGVAASPLPDDDVEFLCRLMSSHVRTTHGIVATSKEARVTKGWRDACRALLNGDGYTRRQLEYAIPWVNRHQYWSRRIKSMTRLRAEMPEVAKQIREERERKQHLTPVDGLSPSARARNERQQRRLQRLQTNPQEAPHERIAEGNGGARSLPAGDPQQAAHHGAVA